MSSSQKIKNKILKLPQDQIENLNEVEEDTSSQADIKQEDKNNI